MGHGGLSNFDRFARRQALWRGSGSREIERPSEQPEYSACDQAFLRANDRPTTRPPGRFARIADDDHFKSATDGGFHAQQLRKP